MYSKVLILSLLSTTRHTKLAWFCYFCTISDSLFCSKIKVLYLSETRYSFSSLHLFFFSFSTDETRLWSQSVGDKTIYTRFPQLGDFCVLTQCNRCGIVRIDDDSGDFYSI